MTRTRMLTVAVIVLLALNVCMMLFAFNRGPHKVEGPKKYIIERLNFDEAQVVRYEVRIKEHQREIAAKEKQLQAKKAELFGLLGKSDRTSALTIQNDIGRIQGEIVEINFSHFEDIEAICTEAQLVDFKSLTSELADLFHPRVPPPPAMSE